MNEDLKEASIGRRNQYDFRLNFLYWCIGVALYGSEMQTWPRRY